MYSISKKNILLDISFNIARGHIYTMGNNEDGRLGIGPKPSSFSSTACLVETISKLRCFSISCGTAHTVAIMTTGEAYGWGDGSSG